MMTCIHYAILNQHPHSDPQPRLGGRGGPVHNVTAAIAVGKRPVPFRTRKLSLPAPMVLHPRECGRVGRRRTNIPVGGCQRWQPPTVFSHVRGSLSVDVDRATDTLSVCRVRSSTTVY